MTVNPTRVSEQPPHPGRPTMAEMIERLSRFDGPPEQFLVSLLSVQCHLAAADAGGILRVVPNQGVEVLAVYPQPAPGATAPVWLAQSAEVAPQVAAGAKTVIKPLHHTEDLYGQPARQHLILVPLRGGSGVLGVATFVVTSNDQASLTATQQRLELTISLLSLYEMRLTLQQRQVDLMRLRLAMETTAAVNEQDRFHGAAMALCNEIASRWRCDRVSLGFLKGRYVHLKAMSHTEKFSRKMTLVQEIEAAMEEALDQDVEVLFPAGAQATFVCRASEELSRKHGPEAVLNLPLRHDRKVAAVVTLERPSQEPFELSEVESLRLTCDLCTPRLEGLHKHDRWFGARAAGAVREGLGALVGSKHTWIKVAGLGVCAAILFLIFVKGQFRATAPFVLESTSQRVVPAPFEGYLKHVYVSPGTEVIGADPNGPTWRFSVKSIALWPDLLDRIRREAAAEGRTIGGRILSMVGPETEALIRQDAAEPAQEDPNQPPPLTPSKAVREQLCRGLNDLLDREGFYDEELWGDWKLSDRQKHLIEALRSGLLKGDRLVELNRSLLVTAYPEEIRPGPTVMATLETAELRLQLGADKAEHLAYQRQERAAMDEDKRAEANIARAQADQVAARIRLIEYKISQAVLLSPIDGQVISRDLEHQLGVAVKMGDALFEVASLGDLRGELSMPEDLIADVQLAFAKAQAEGRPLSGTLAATARPKEHISFTVVRINPVAELVDQKNVFKVRVRMGERPHVFRPGMEGVGKIDIDRRSYGYIWTRRLVNWVRMKLWL